MLELCDALLRIGNGCAKSTLNILLQAFLGFFCKSFNFFSRFSSLGLRYSGSLALNFFTFTNIDTGLFSERICGFGSHFAQTFCFGSEHAVNPGSFVLHTISGADTGEQDFVCIAGNGTCFNFDSLCSFRRT